MKKEYGFILIAYIAMQLSSLIGIDLMAIVGRMIGINESELAVFSVSTWLLFSFFVTFILVLFLLRREDHHREALPIGESVSWAIRGIFLAFFAQYLAAYIEYLLGIEIGSENTEQIVGLIETAPLVMIVTSILGPILEEIVFRKILFGSLYQRMNFFLAAMISSVVFALAHGEPEHLLLYSAMGLTFAYLYVKTKRIIVPIVAHVSMNTIVVILQVNQDKLEQYQNLQSIIGGF